MTDPKPAIPPKTRLLLVAAPLAACAMAGAAAAFCGVKNLEPPEWTWAALAAGAGIAAANAILPSAIESEWTRARLRGEAPGDAARGKQGLLVGLFLAAVLVDFLYLRAILDAKHPFGQILLGAAMIAVGIFGIWFMLTRHDALWEALRQATAGEVKLPAPLRRPGRFVARTLLWIHHSRAGRILFLGIGYPFLIFAGAYAIWMNPVAALERAQAGEARWQFEAARRYMSGDGLPKDAAKAFGMYLAAARQGYDRAYFFAGRMLREGIGAPQNHAEAVFWLKKASETRQPEAPGAWLLLGFAHALGDGAVRDPAEAARCFRRAAEGGDATGEFGLALAYEEGFGVKEDKAMALYWFEKAAGSGHREAQAKADELRAQGVTARKSGAEEAK
jgi:hypothetical protein